MLYPLKFTPQLKERIWGGSRLRENFNKIYPLGVERCGESWELSGVDENISIVSNGFLAGNSIQELAEIYMGELMGEKVFQKFGVEFPLLVKLIDTADFLSVQVHPDDKMANRLHHAYGKTEMWYIISSDPDSTIITGFDGDMTREHYMQVLSTNSFKNYLKHEQTQADDFIFIPARSLHAIGKGITLLEIQQTSDITYRIYDWDRVNENGIGRELHTGLALQALDFEAKPLQVEKLPIAINAPQELISSYYFSVNRLVLNNPIERDFYQFDTFRIYCCIEGKLSIETLDNELVSMVAGELVLVPASIGIVEIIPDEQTKLLEVYIL